MKSIAIVWNSMENNFEEALSDIAKKVEILDCIKVDFQDEFNKFISDIYPYTGNERWKLDYKINALDKKYTKNEIIILFLDMAASNKIYVERKNVYLYENVESLKQFIREKYRKIIDNYCFDNVFHMTDDEDEYRRTRLIIKRHLLNILSKNRYNDLDQLFGISKEYSNNAYDKREKIWFADNMFMFKKDKENTFESYAELFSLEIANILEIEHAYYRPISYKNEKGVLTVNFLNENEELIEGTKLIEFFLKGKKIDIKDINTICMFNNLERIPLIIEYYCEYNNLIYNNGIITELKKIFAYDMLLMQTDRNPYNWGIIVDNNKNIRLAPIYDNSNFMGMNKDINKKADYSLLYYYQMPKVLLYDFKNLYHDNNIDIMNSITDPELLDIFRLYLEKLKSINLDNIFETIEVKYGIEIPELFRHTIINIYIKNLDIINIKTNTKNKRSKK